MARESFRSPRLVATTLREVPFLKSASLVWTQWEVLTASALVARERTRQVINPRMAKLRQDVGIISLVRYQRPRRRALRAWRSWAFLRLVG